MSPETVIPPQRPHVWHANHAQALLPTLGMLGGLPWANRVHPLVVGLPFLMARLVGSMIGTARLMACILVLDRRHETGQAP